MKQLRQHLLDACEEELPALQNIEGFGGDTGYRDAIIEQVKGLQQLAENDYPALIKIVATEQSDLTSEDVNAYNQAIQKLNTALGPLSEQVNTALQQLLRNNVPKPAVRGTKQI
jgi:two-component SAPR family response regulator